MAAVCAGAVVTGQPHTPAGAMDRPRVAPTEWRGLPAWRVDAAHGPGSVVIMQYGGHLARIDGAGGRRDDGNPYWSPPWPAAPPCSRPDATDARFEALYGAGPEGRLLAGIAGHSLCLDRFGPPRQDAADADGGRPIHGEAGVVRWRHAPDTGAAAAADAAVFEADLPAAGLRVTRAFRLDHATRTVWCDGSGRTQARAVVVHLTTSVVAAAAAPQPVEWCEHVSLDGDFVDGADADVEASVDGAWLAPPGMHEPDASRFGADSQPLQAVDVARALAFPRAADRAAGDIVTARCCGDAAGRAWWRITNRRLRRALSYEWPAARLPFLCLWTQHRSRRHAPWNGITRVRGMEMSTKPYPEGRPPPERASEFQCRPTVCLVPPDAAGLSMQLHIEWLVW